jgi:hypothetical protein
MLCHFCQRYDSNQEKEAREINKSTVPAKLQRNIYDYGEKSSKVTRQHNQEILGELLFHGLTLN